jgi:hypothetical protein
MYLSYDILVIELWLKENQRQCPFITVHLTSQNINAHVSLAECLQREIANHFTAFVHADTSTAENTTLMSLCILTKENVFLKICVVVLDFIQLSY